MNILKSQALRFLNSFFCHFPSSQNYIVSLLLLFSICLRKNTTHKYNFLIHINGKTIIITKFSFPFIRRKRNEKKLWKIKTSQNVNAVWQIFPSCVELPGDGCSQWNGKSNGINRAIQKSFINHFSRHYFKAFSLNDVRRIHTYLKCFICFIWRNFFGVNWYQVSCCLPWKEMRSESRWNCQFELLRLKLIRKACLEIKKVKNAPYFRL